jgi:hypothetical protein
VGWQSTVAVIVGDALILAPAMEARASWIVFCLLYAAGVLTLLLVIASIKWNARSDWARERLRKLGEEHKFDKYSKEEGFLLNLHVAEFMIGLMLVVGLGLIATGFLVMVGVPFGPFTTGIGHRFWTPR